MNLMSAPRIVATYRIETPRSLEAAAESMAGEQSTGTFTRVPGETAELCERFGARVESVIPLESAHEPALPGSAKSLAAGEPTYYRGEVTISFPVDSMGANLPTIFSTIAGNLFELRQLSGLRLLDVVFPPSLVEQFPGPQFGIDGTRRLVGVDQRPIIGTIVKPSVGLSPVQTADIVRALGEAGIDFIKDDELMANSPHSPLTERVAAVMPVIKELAERTGRKIMFAFNISDQFEQMLHHHDTVLAAGGTCVMISLNSVGLVAAEALRQHCQLPIHGHRNGWGMFYRCPDLGMDYRAYHKFWRLAGIDHLHVNGLENKFVESNDSVVASIQACLDPLPGAADGYRAMPVVSSGQWGGQAPETYHRTGTTDLMYLAGGGIMAHPMGPAAGVVAIQQAWQAAIDGIDLETYAESHRELHASIEFYGGLAGNQR